MHFERWKPRFVPNTTESMGHRMFDQISHTAKWTPPAPGHIIWHTFSLFSMIHYATCHAILCPVPFPHSPDDRFFSLCVHLHFRYKYFFFTFFLLIFNYSFCSWNLCVYFSFKNIFFFNFLLAFNGVAHLTHSWLDAILVRDACMSLLIAIVAEMDVSNCCCGRAEKFVVYRSRNYNMQQRQTQKLHVI